ncbi:MAG: DUF1926 domain-containing protein [Deltaproteobacteria bacterium]|nr:DUF1926 domain-containing protein [Deltaproteobacteria bacterium]
MSQRLKLLFGVHIHQPLGNFPSVYEKLYQICYRPFLTMMSQHPSLKFSFHASGHLLQWMEENHGEIVELLGNMVNCGQLELLTGGFYEPILAAIPRRDRKGQIQLYQRYLKKKFGVDPWGIWLTERVWEPQIAEDLIALGIRFVLVDDRHFRVCGFDPGELHSYYLTEAEGKPLAVFPIDERLRYCIPFRLVEEFTRYLEGLHQENHEAAIYVDDGEKFGGWPGTQEWVYEKKWLDHFLENLESLQGTFLETTTFSDYLKREPSKGICYLPNASYTEMEEWSLPATKGLELQTLKKRLSDNGEQQVYLRGGHWKNFLVKYPEANRMHKKMIILSEMVEQKRRGRRLSHSLYKAQCNDAYWHGVFGGLYLPHLRHAVWHNLAEVEKGLREGERMRIEIRDMALDGGEELWAHSQHFSAVFQPHHGGHLKEYVLFSAGVNYLNTLTRRFEAYHRPEDREKEGENDGKNGVASIHHLTRTSQGEVLSIDYDPFERGSFVDRFFTCPLTLEDFKKCRFTELGDFGNQPFTYKVSGRKIAMRREGAILFSDNPKKPIEVVKEFDLSSRGFIKAHYRLYNSGPEEIPIGFGIEFNLSPPVMNPEGGRLRAKGIEVPLGGEGSATEVEEVDLFDWFSRCLIEMRWSVPAALLFFPVETLSQSEQGFDFIPQQLCLMPQWSISLKPGDSWEVKIAWQVRRIE